MTESPDLAATSRAGSTGRGDKLAQWSDIVKGNYANPHLSEWIFNWSGCLCGLAVPFLLWFRKDVPRAFQRGGPCA